MPAIPPPASISPPTVTPVGSGNLPVVVASDSAHVAGNKSPFGNWQPSDQAATRAQTRVISGMRLINSLNDEMIPGLVNAAVNEARQQAIDALVEARVETRVQERLAEIDESRIQKRVNEHLQEILGENAPDHVAAASSRSEGTSFVASTLSPHDSVSAACKPSSTHATPLTPSSIPENRADPSTSTPDSVGADPSSSPDTGSVSPSATSNASDKTRAADPTPENPEKAQQPDVQRALLLHDTIRNLIINLLLDMSQGKPVDEQRFADANRALNALVSAQEAQTFHVPRDPPQTIQELIDRTPPWIWEVIRYIQLKSTRYECSVDAIVSMLLFYAFSGWGSFKILPQYKVRKEVMLSDEDLAYFKSLSDDIKLRIKAENEGWIAQLSTDSLNRVVAARSEGRASYVIPEFLVCAVDIHGRPSRVILFVEDKLNANPLEQLMVYFDAFKHEVEVYGLGCRIVPVSQGGQGIQAMLWRRAPGGGPALRVFDEGHNASNHSGWYRLDSDFILQHLVNLCKENWKYAANV
ncbi:uncharacterized protein BXZ73DRAFT_109027 [Epithele typhae]|uniref:uncharacterized protein n=1 Tax=Epithele typhae TaxID=378194 RepID=UPI002008CC91|nr:uncharacterized protein BXZ73DRAFT_109027 [Epithele typhae]KAH9910417.1 hypothetical protein BXZ73DRAFT_109027 [Epithele typhae]